MNCLPLSALRKSSNLKPGRANAEIPIVLGKEASGKPLVADLTKMPHLGSRFYWIQTVCINAIIASLCYHSSPEDVRFIMVSKNCRNESLQ